MSTATESTTSPKATSQVTHDDIRALTEQVQAESQLIDEIFAEIATVIVGQRAMVERLIIGLLCKAHVLLEGVPGLAKTLAVKSLASTFEASFARLQFTPDLLPADLIGTLIFNQKENTFEPKKGPIFANFVLADEINRAPAKVQSALLEAMQERQVTIGDATYKLPAPFLVLATQNPIEQEGTYPLPEAQVDRFMLKLKVGYPKRSEERLILDRMTDPVAKGTERGEIRQVCKGADVLRLANLVEQIYIADEVKEYILDVVAATRDPSPFNAELKGLIDYGASPRATIALAQASKAHAFLRHRAFVTPDDIKAIGPDVLRHRVVLTYEAEAENIEPDDMVQKIFDSVKVR